MSMKSTVHNNACHVIRVSFKELIEAVGIPDSENLHLTHVQLSPDMNNGRSNSPNVEFIVYRRDA